MKITSKTFRLWNLAATLITILMLISAGGRLKAYLVPAQGEPAAQTPTAAQPEAAKSEAERGSKNESKPESKEGGEEAPRNELYTWINFIILAGALAFLLKKLLGPFLKSRGEAIQEDMKRSSEALQNANSRLGAIENRLMQMNEEIAALRAAALQEAAAERGRIEDTARADAQKVANAAEMEIASAAKQARQELKAYASELALGLAETKLQQSMSPEAERQLFSSFIEDLSGSPGNGVAGKPGASKGGA